MSSTEFLSGIVTLSCQGILPKVDTVILYRDVSIDCALSSVV